jgi:hypothetical protein
MGNKSVTRRSFLASAAATSSLALLPQSRIEAQDTALAAKKTAQLPMPVVKDKVVLQAKLFPMPQVRLLPSHWQDMMELNQRFLYSLPNDRLAHDSTTMIYKDSRPEDSGGVIPMPEVTGPGIWFEHTEATAEYPIRFKSTGGGPIHTLVPLGDIVDERYSIYVRNTTVKI